MTCANDGSQSTLALEGSLAERAVDDLAAVASAAMGGDTTLTILLTGLTFVDARGVALLQSLARRGARLTGGSAFVTALIAERPQ